MKLDEGFEWSANLFQRRFWTPIFPILFQHSSGNSLQPRKTSVDIVSKRDEIRTWYISCVYSVATVSVRRYRTLRVYVVVCWCLLLFMCTNKRVFVFVCVCVCMCVRARARARAMLSYAFKIPVYETQNDSANVWGGHTFITATICRTTYNN